MSLISNKIIIATIKDYPYPINPSFTRVQQHLTRVTFLTRCNERAAPQLLANIICKTHNNPEGCFIALILLIKKLYLRQGSFLKVTWLVNPCPSNLKILTKQLRTPIPQGWAMPIKCSLRHCKPVVHNFFLTIRGNFSLLKPWTDTYLRHRTCPPWSDSH